MSKYSNPVRKKELDAGLMGIGGLMTFNGHNSASRQVMSSGQIGQALATSFNSKRRLFTGSEFEFGRFTFKHQMPEDGTIVEVIPKFQMNNIFQEDIAENPRTIVIFEAFDENRERYFDILDLSVYNKLHPQYGFRYKFNEHVTELLEPGKPIPKGLVFADSPNVDEQGNYNYGFDVNVAMMSHPACIEDGFIISESLRRNLVVNAYGERSISVGKDQYLLNIYGDQDNYKPFPSIGELIRPDRVLFAAREYIEKMAVVDMMSPRKDRPGQTQIPQWMFDKCVYVEKAGKVIDITVYKNNARKSNLPTRTTQWLDRWHQMNYNFHARIISEYNKLQRRFPGGFIISPRFETLLVEAMSFTNSGPRNDQLVRTINGQPLDEYNVHITYEYKYTPIVGAKFTGGAGDKGVTVCILPDDEMPVDAAGNRADIVVDDFSTIKRMNTGRTYEQEIGAACLAVEKETRRLYETEGMDKAWAYLSGFYKIAAPEMYDKIMEVGIDKNPKQQIESAIYDMLRLWVPEHQAKENQDIVSDIWKHYPPVKGPVTYVDLGGNRVTTRSPVLIGPMYFMLLEKTATTFMATASTRYQHHGILSTVQGAARNAAPARNNPTRTAGESEVRLFAHVMDGDAVAELLEQTNDPGSHAFIVDKIHSTPQPSRIDRVIDRTKVPRGNARPVQFINHQFECSGFGLYHEEEKQ